MTATFNIITVWWSCLLAIFSIFYQCCNDIVWSSPGVLFGIDLPVIETQTKTIADINGHVAEA